MLAVSKLLFYVPYKCVLWFSYVMLKICKNNRWLWQRDSCLFEEHCSGLLLVISLCKTVINCVLFSKLLCSIN